MSRPGLATREQLARWADTRQSQSELPRFVRRLILETSPDLIELGMPAGEGVAVGDWDGSARSSGTHPWVPDGLSVWELSVDKRPGKKANTDYAKRMDTPDGTAPADATYVQLILRVWSDRKKWATDRRAEKRWRDVRAYGLDDVESWLESASVTWAWISEELGLSPYGLRTGSTWWDAWASQTSPIFPPELVLAGRDKQVGAIREKVGIPGVTTVASASPNETCAFLAGAAVKADADGDGRMLARLAFVDERSTWRRLIETPQPLVLVPLDQELAHEVPSQSPHSVFVPVRAAGGAEVSLPPLDASGVAGALKLAGITDNKRADAAGRLARRSLTALRRNLASNAALHQPPWSQVSASRFVRAALLAGSWNDQQEGDRSVLVQLSGADYEAFRDQISTLADPADPLIQRVGESWHLVAPHDAWLLLGDRLNDDDLKHFETVVVTVLGEEDPALELPEDERWWRASFEGKVRAFSRDLRQGLAKSMALLGVHGASISLSGGYSGSLWTHHLVRKILDSANKDSSGRAWNSISDLLPLLAEAGPDAFITAVTAGTKGDSRTLSKIFTDREQGLFSSSSPHTGLLWALEGLAWSQEHFGAAVDLLACLDEMDPGGRLSNRPLASLVNIFCPWHPDNCVTPERRLAVIDGLRKRHNQTAWKLLLSMLPEFRGTHFPTRDPEFRDWKPERSPVTNVEYFGFISAVVERSIAEAGTDGSRWDNLIDRYHNLPPADRSAVAGALSELIASNSLDKASRELLWSALRELVGQHRTYSSAQWALPEEDLGRLDALIDQLQPETVSKRYEWLFQNQMPNLADVRWTDDHAGYEIALSERRREAIREIDAEGGLDAVRRLATSDGIIASVGIALADAKPLYDAELWGDLESEVRSELYLAGDYYGQRFRQNGWEWLEETLGQHGDSSPLAQARLLIAIRDFPRVFEHVDALGESVAEAYWRNFLPFGLGHDFDNIDLVAQRLMGVRRNAMALDFLCMYSHGNDLDEERLSELMADGLEGLLGGDDPEIGRPSAYDFERIFGLLELHRDSLGLARVARLEWSLLPALGYESNVPALHEAMSADPGFFADVVCTVYRARTGDDGDEEGEQAEPPREEENDVQEARRARNGYQLLKSWRLLPGLADGQIDHDGMHAWVNGAVSILNELGRLEVGLLHFGQVLASAPPDSDGTWPPEIVRDLLEELKRDEVESGLRDALINSRGVTTRGLEDGGAQEEALSQRYRTDADRLADVWPRSAALLRSLAEFYETDARRNENSAERWRRGLN